MRIAILGTGVVARALHAGWTRHGHDVVLGTRDPAASGSKPELRGLPLAGFADAVDGADVVALALAGSATADVVASLTDSLAGKVVIDATNPLEFGPDGIGLFVGTTDSLGERVQRAAPAARVVKAYNTVGNTLMVDPQLAGGPPTMLIAGNDSDAKAVVSGLLGDTGWAVIDAGGIRSSRWLEAMAVAWVICGQATGSWEHAFRVLTA